MIILNKLVKSEDRSRRQKYKYAVFNFGLQTTDFNYFFIMIKEAKYLPFMADNILKICVHSRSQTFRGRPLFQAITTEEIQKVLPYVRSMQYTVQPSIDIGNVCFAMNVCLLCPTKLNYQ